MNKKQLIDRWYVNQDLLKNVLKTISKHQDLEIGLDKINGRLDLRGAPLCSVEKEINVGNSEHQLTLNIGSLNVRSYNFNDIDFSYAEMSSAVFKQCSFVNCLFDHTKARGIEFSDCDFAACEFLNSDFSYAYMSTNIGSKAGSFINCNFFKVDLRESTFTFPLVEDCIFEDCKLLATNFDGSRMKNINFKGKVDSPWFNGFSTRADKSVLWVFNRIDPREFPNEMINVDFSDAELIGAAFGHGIKLDNCIFPKDDDMYLYVHNIQTVYPKAIEIISKEWESHDQRVALSMIEEFYFGKSKQDQKADFIDRHMLSEGKFSVKFFALLRKLNTQG